MQEAQRTHGALVILALIHRRSVARTGADQTRQPSVGARAGQRSMKAAGVAAYLEGLVPRLLGEAGRADRQA